MSRGAFYVLFTASGFAGLIYESIWTHYLKLFLGHAAYAQSLVLDRVHGRHGGRRLRCARGFRARIAQPAARLRRGGSGGRPARARLPPGVRRARPTGAYASLLPALGSEGGGARGKLALSCLLILPQSLLLGATFPLMSAG